MAHTVLIGACQRMNHTITKTPLHALVATLAIVGLLPANVAGWSAGIDNADSQKFKIRSAFNFTGTSVMTLENNNNASFAGRMFQSTSYQVPMMVFGSQIVTSQNNSFFGVTITVNIPFTPTSNNIVVTVMNGDRGANNDFTPLSALWDTTSTVWVTCRGTNGFAARINWCAQFLY